MDFFKSVFADDPDSPSPRSEPQSSSPSQHDPPTEPSPAAEGTGVAGGWSFGGLVKTLTNQSESLLETYRRDLEEFGSGLKKETVTFREVASRAVKDLPSSIEISATKAQGAFTSIADIIAQGKETLLAPDLDSFDSSDYSAGNLSAQSVASGRLSRFEIQLRAIQCDLNTYLGDPEDVGDYDSWKLGFQLGEKRDEIDELMRGNEAIAEIYKKVVPDSVDHDEFWFRYYFRVHRLQLAESVRANLVKRAISKDDDDEELSWDVDDDVDEEVKKADTPLINSTDSPSEGVDLVDNSPNLGEISADQVAEDSSHTVVDDKEKIDVAESIKEDLANLNLSSEQTSESKCNKPSDDEAVPEAKAESTESGNDTNMTVAVSPKEPSPDEEDLGWDEIEDLGSDDDDADKKLSSADSGSNRPELRKRLSVAEDDEDLSWEIEDDDVTAKS